METIYLVMIIVLFILAISDLIVGVSNDAVNFLNSAVGSKAATFKTILLVAVLGLLAGATFSSGMMEVARKGIFHPQHFLFSEIMLVFLAVMITDVILLDTFNTFGMPTSTTVSIVFELLGAAVAMAAIKVYTDPNALELGEYINSGKALAIISGILLSVVVAFTSGAILQWITRYIFTFDYEKRFKKFGSIWGGIAIAAITYFILVKGSKSASFMDKDMKQSIIDNTWVIIGLSFIIWTIILQIVNTFTKWNTLKFIVLVGTFSLAMAFSGNDLVNFIGVPLAGYNSYLMYLDNGSQDMLMVALSKKVPTPTLLLLIAGLIMVVTLWLSKKAQRVIKTSLDLGRQESGYERFKSFSVTRTIVRKFGSASNSVNKILPQSIKAKIETNFDQRPFSLRIAGMGEEAPSFDMIRASVTLMVSAILISVGTILKLPLSTTYVTFMVFMGASLADGAWGRESAVYRISGVFSVIGGWFFTAFSAFTMAFIIAGIFYFGGPIMIGIFILLAIFLIYKSNKYHNQKLENMAEEVKEMEAKFLSMDNVLEDFSKQISKVFNSYKGAIEDSIIGIETEDLKRMNASKRIFEKIDNRITTLKGNLNKRMHSITDDEVEAAHLYVLLLDYLKEMGDHIERFTFNNLDHVDNNHKPLIPNQITELRKLQSMLVEQFEILKKAIASKDLKDVDNCINLSETIFKETRSVRKNQIKRIQAKEVGTRNSQLFFNQIGEMRNISLYSSRMARIINDLVLVD